MNKKGVATEHLFLFIILAFVALILIGTFLYVYDTMTNSLLDAGVDAGQVNLTNATLSTLGQINTSMQNYADIIGIFLLFGMIFAMFIVAYLTRDHNPAIFFVIDILVVIFAYILAVYITNSYETVLGAIPFLSIFTSNLSLSSSFVLLLPKIVVIVGAIVMIISYSAIPKTKEEQVGGY